MRSALFNRCEHIETRELLEQQHAERMEADRRRDDERTRQLEEEHRRRVELEREVWRMRAAALVEDLRRFEARETATLSEIAQLRSVEGVDHAKLDEAEGVSRARLADVQAKRERLELQLRTRQDLTD